MTSTHSRLLVVTMLSSLFFIAGNTFAQQHRTKVHLKDGTILQGRIYIDNDFYIELIKQHSNDTIQIGYKHINSVGEPPKYSRIKPPKIVRTEGIAITLMGDVLYDFALSEVFYSQQLTITKRIQQGKFNIGLTTAYHHVKFRSNFNTLQSKLISAGIYGRYYLNQRKLRFLIDGKIGYSLALEDIDQQGFTHQYNGGIASALGVGMHLPSSKNASMIIRAGVNHLKTDGQFEFNFRNGNRTVYSRKLVHPYVGIAIEF